MSKSESSAARAPPIDPETTTASIDGFISYALANDSSSGFVLPVVVLLIISDATLRCLKPLNQFFRLKTDRKSFLSYPWMRPGINRMGKTEPAPAYWQSDRNLTDQLMMHPSVCFVGTWINCLEALDRVPLCVHLWPLTSSMNVFKVSL